MKPGPNDVPAARAAALTHGHEQGYIPAAALADDLFHDCRIDQHTLGNDAVWVAKYLDKTFSM